MEEQNQLLNVELTDNCVLVSFREPTVLRSENSEIFEKELFACMEVGDKEPIVLNLENLRYVSSLGIRVIVLFYRELNQKKRAIRLCGLNEPVKQIFIICQLDLLIPIFEDCKEAMKA
jgi:anti-anti-sigma factor